MITSFIDSSLLNIIVMDIKTRLLLFFSYTAIITIIVSGITRYYTIKTELTSNGYPSIPSGLIEDTMEIYTFDNIYFIDFQQMKVFNEMNSEEIYFSSLTLLFDYIGDKTANESSLDPIVSSIAQHSWITIDSIKNQIELHTHFGADPNHGVHINKFGLYKNPKKKLGYNITYLPE